MNWFNIFITIANRTGVDTKVNPLRNQTEIEVIRLALEKDIETY